VLSHLRLGCPGRPDRSAVFTKEELTSSRPALLLMRRPILYAQPDLLPKIYRGLSETLGRLILPWTRFLVTEVLQVTQVLIFIPLFIAHRGFLSGYST
jgi:hypothetical protein